MRPSGVFASVVAREAPALPSPRGALVMVHS
jgi:hypothetical protein